MSDGFTKLSTNVCSLSLREVKEGSLSISVQRDCAIDEIDYYWHSLSTSEKGEEENKKKKTNQNSYIEHHSTELLCPVSHPLVNIIRKRSHRLWPFVVKLVSVTNSFPEKNLLCPLKSSKGSVATSLLRLLRWVWILVCSWHELTEKNQNLQWLSLNEKYLKKTLLDKIHTILTQFFLDGKLHGK